MSYNFLSTGLLHSCLNLFLDILSFFDATVNGIILLDSLSDSSLLACKNATDFWIFIFYSATLLNSFISSSFFGRIFRVLYIQYHGICQVDFLKISPAWEVC